MKALVAPQFVVIPCTAVRAAPDAAIAAPRVMTTLVPTEIPLAATDEPCCIAHADRVSAGCKCNTERIGTLRHTALPSTLPSDLFKPGTQSITGTNDVTTPTPSAAAS
jgi:hypothetical protein